MILADADIDVSITGYQFSQVSCGKGYKISQICFHKSVKHWLSILNEAWVGCATFSCLK